MQGLEINIHQTQKPRLVIQALAQVTPSPLITAWRNLSLKVLTCKQDLLKLLLGNHTPSALLCMWDSLQASPKGIFNTWIAEVNRNYFCFHLPRMFEDLQVNTQHNQKETEKPACTLCNKRLPLQHLSGRQKSTLPLAQSQLKTPLKSSSPGHCTGLHTPTATQSAYRL